MEESGEHVKHLEQTPPDQGVRWRHGSTVFGYMYLMDIFKIECMSFLTLFFSSEWPLFVDGYWIRFMDGPLLDLKRIDQTFTNVACSITVSSDSHALCMHSFYPAIVRYRQLMDTLSWLVLGVWFFLIESPRLSAMTKRTVQYRFCLLVIWKHCFMI